MANEQYALEVIDESEELDAVVAAQALGQPVVQEDDDEEGNKTYYYTMSNALICIVLLIIFLVITLHLQELFLND